MMVKSSMASNMVKGFNIGLMVPFMMDNGLITRHVEKAFLLIQMEINTMESGKMIKLMDSEFSLMLSQEQNTKEIG